MRSLFFSILLCCIACISSAQDPCNCASYEIDFRQFREAKDAGNPETAEKIASFLIGQKATLCEALGLDLMANLRVSSAKIEEGLALLVQEKVLLDSLACSYESYLDYFSTKSFYHYSQDEYDSSVANSMKALDIAESTGNVARQISLRLGIGSAFYRTGQLEKKLEYAKSIIPLIEQVDDSSLQSQYYFNLFGAYYVHFRANREQKGFLDSAEWYNKKAFALARLTGNRRFLAFCYEALEIVNRERNGPASLGLVYVDSAIFFSRGALNTATLSELLINKAYLLADLDKNALAEVYADSALHYSAKNPQRSVYASHLIDASDLFAQLSDHKRSLQLYKLGAAIKDSILSVEKAKMARELEAKYNLEKTEKQVAQLFREKAESRAQQAWMLALMGLSALTALVLYFFYKQKLSSQREKMAIQKQQLLRSQINPHFIFNALSSIRGYLFSNKDVMPAIEYLGKFARLMRNILDLSEKEWVSLKEEMHAVELFLQIQQLRYNNSFGYQIEIGEGIETDTVFVPPLTAQPFIENAIEHGLSQVKHTGIIYISCKLDGDKIFFAIQDNGIGIDRVQKRSEHQSKAIKIFKERLSLLAKNTKSHFSFSIEDVGNFGEGSGTRVSYQLPVRVMEA